MYTPDAVAPPASTSKQEVGKDAPAHPAHGERKECVTSLGGQGQGAAAPHGPNTPVPSQQLAPKQERKRRQPASQTAAGARRHHTHPYALPLHKMVKRRAAKARAGQAVAPAIVVCGLIDGAKERETTTSCARHTRPRLPRPLCCLLIRV